MSFTFRHYRYEILRRYVNTKCKYFVIYLCILLEFEFHSLSTCTIIFEVQKLSFKCVERDIRCDWTCTVQYFLNILLKIWERLWTSKGTRTRTFNKLFKVFKQTIHYRRIHILEDPLDSPRKIWTAPRTKWQSLKKKRHRARKKKGSPECTGRELWMRDKRKKTPAYTGRRLRFSNENHILGKTCNIWEKEIDRQSWHDNLLQLMSCFVVSSNVKIDINRFKFVRRVSNLFASFWWFPVSVHVSGLCAERLRPSLGSAACFPRMIQSSAKWRVRHAHGRSMKFWTEKDVCGPLVPREGARWFLDDREIFFE